MRTVLSASRLKAFCACSAIAVFSFAAVGSSFSQSGSPVQALGTLSDISSSSSNPQAALGSSPTMVVPEDFSKLKIAPGFQLSLQTFEVPDLSGFFRVEETGDILVPLAGTIHVAGLTSAEASDVIEKRFQERDILKHPQVSVSIQQYPSYMISVLGEVKFPGRIGLIAPHSLLDVLSLAGGETVVAGDRVQVRHTGGALEEYVYKRNSNGQTINTVSIAPGDTVIVPRAGIVYVLGSVTRPGGYLMQEDGDLNVAQALSMALGPNLQAKVSDMRIVRHKADGTYEAIPIQYRKFTSGKVVPAKLNAEDIVYVPVSKLKTVFTAGSGLIGAAATSTVYAFRP